jgi:hypothetical protein
VTISSTTVITAQSASGADKLRRPSPSGDVADSDRALDADAAQPLYEVNSAGFV